MSYHSVCSTWNLNLNQKVAFIENGPPFNACSRITLPGRCRCEWRRQPTNTPTIPAIKLLDTTGYMLSFWNKFGSSKKSKSNIISNCECFPYYNPEQSQRNNKDKNSERKKKRVVARTDKQQAWLAHLKATSVRQIMSNPAAATTSTTDYEQMQDPLHSKPSYHKQSSSSGLEIEAEDELEEEVYIVKQSYGYFAILFSLAQTAILIIMMVRCGVAPINVNPMIGPYPGELFWNEGILFNPISHL